MQETLSERTAERDQLERALASTGDMVIALDRDARIRYLNPAAELTLRSGDREPIGAPLLEAVEDPDLYDAVRLAIEDGTPAVLVVLRAERRFRTVVAPVADVAESGPWSVVLAMHDLSDLYEAEIARRDFFINASHELRTPLASISAAAETLEAVSRPKDSERFRAIIQSEAGRMSQLVEEMLALARLESGLTEPADGGRRDGVAARRRRRQHPSPGRARRAVAALCRTQGWPRDDDHGRSRIGSSAPCSTSCTTRSSSPTRAGAIEVLSELGDDSDPAPMVWIRVRDTGIGIEPAEQSRIFQRFYRIDRARQSGGGTGLGLAVVRHIAEVHGGAVSLESAPGQGSTFGFSVPLAQQG